MAGKGTLGHYQTAVARVMVVVGEFHWQDRTGETATVTDYVAPPGSASFGPLIAPIGANSFPGRLILAHGFLRVSCRYPRPALLSGLCAQACTNCTLTGIHRYKMPERGLIGIARERRKLT